MNLVNLTPHAIHMMNENNDVIFTIPRSGQVARCETRRVMTGKIHITYDNDMGELYIATLPINKTEYGQVTGLPEPEVGTYYIVSAIVAQAVRGQRDDVLIVDDTVRDESGRIIGARALARM
jgi:hypothetical protein